MRTYTVRRRVCGAITLKPSKVKKKYIQDMKKIQEITMSTAAAETTMALTHKAILRRLCLLFKISWLWHHFHINRCDDLQNLSYSIQTLFSSHLFDLILYRPVVTFYCWVKSAKNCVFEREIFIIVEYQATNRRNMDRKTVNICALIGFIAVLVYACEASPKYDSNPSKRWVWWSR